MCGGGGVLSSILPIIADVAATVTGNPELIPLIQGGSTLLQGGSVGDALKSGGLAFAGTELAPALGNLFQSVAPETAASLGVGGGANSLTDLLGQTTGGGSLTGAGTIGGDLLGNAAPGSGVAGLTNSIDGLFSGSPTAGTDVGSPSFGAGLSPETPTALTAASPSATAPSALSTSYTPATGAGLGSSAGGAAGGGVALSPDSGFSASGAGSALPWQTGTAPLDPSIAAINPGTTDYSSGIGAPPQSGGIANLFSSPNTGTFSGDLSGNPVGASALSAPEQLTAATGAAISPTGGNMSSSISNLLGGGGGTNALSGIARSLLMGGLNNANNKGYDAQMTAGQNIENEYQPFVTTGNQANTTLANLFGENGAAPGAQAAAQANFANTPGYQFALTQGENAIAANAAATGQTLSGNNQQAVQNYGTGLANQTYQQYVNNLQNQVGTGLSAAGGVATGMAGVGNAQAGKSGAAANNQNATVGGIANSLFPPSSLQSLMMMFGGAGNMGYT